MVSLVRFCCQTHNFFLFSFSLFCVVCYIMCEYCRAVLFLIFVFIMVFLQNFFKNEIFICLFI